jgi:hypothetical protein
MAGADPLDALLGNQKLRLNTLPALFYSLPASFALNVLQLAGKSIYKR